MIPQTQEIQIPTKAQLEAQLNSLVVQRSQAKDQIEAIEKQLPVLSGMLQLLKAQEAKADADAEVPSAED